MEHNPLSIFKKHLHIQTEYTHYIPSNIKDINQIIGALQTLDRAIQKCLSIIDDPLCVAKIISECSFMGESLFERNILIEQINQSFFIDDLSILLQKHPQDEVRKYIQSKHDEIMQILDLIFISLEGETTSPQTSYEVSCY